MTALIAVVYSKNGWRRSFRRRQTRFVDCTYRSVSSRNPRGTNSDNLRSTRNNSTVNRRVPSHLRLHVEDSSSHRTSIHSKFQSQDEIAACLQAFAQATGWGVRSTSNKQIRQADENGDAVPSKSPSFKSGFRLDEEKSKATPRRNADSSNEDSDGSASVPRWKLVDAAPMDGILSANDLQHFPTVTLENAEMLMATIERLVDRLEKTEAALRRQEAELATNVSVSRSPNEQEELADRLQSIIASSGKSIGSSAAAIYLLDDTTSSLKLRSAWGLPAYKLTEPRVNCEVRCPISKHYSGMLFCWKIYRRCLSGQVRKILHRRSLFRLVRKPCRMERFGFGLIRLENTLRLKSRLQILPLGA
jgi:hypothetical protein